MWENVHLANCTGRAEGLMSQFMTAGAVVKFNNTETLREAR